MREGLYYNGNVFATCTVAIRGFSSIGCHLILSLTKEQFFAHYESHILDVK